jgi:uncharacterized protein YfaP (DUF2135 family)
MNITLTRPWSDRESIERTVDYPAGTFDVADDVAARALAAGVIAPEPDAQEEPTDVIAPAPSRPDRPKRR